MTSWSIRFLSTKKRFHNNLALFFWIKQGRLVGIIEEEGPFPNTSPNTSPNTFPKAFSMLFPKEFS